MKCNQSRLGFELVSPCSFPTTITITLQAPPLVDTGCFFLWTASFQLFCIFLDFLYWKQWSVCCFYFVFCSDDCTQKKFDYLNLKFKVKALRLTHTHKILRTPHKKLNFLPKQIYQGLKNHFSWNNQKEILAYVIKRRWRLCFSHWNVYSSLSLPPSLSLSLYIYIYIRVCVCIDIFIHIYIHILSATDRLYDNSSVWLDTRLSCAIVILSVSERIFLVYIHIYAISFQSAQFMRRALYLHVCGSK